MWTKYVNCEVFTSFRDDPIIVDYNFSPGYPGSWYRRNGDPGDPPEPPELDVLSARYEGRDIFAEMTSAEQEELYEALMEVHYDNEYDSRGYED